METKIRQLASQGWPIAVVGILLIGCVIIGVSGGLYLLLRDDDEGPPTIPILVDDTSGGGQVSGVTSGVAVTSGISEPDSGEGRLQIRLSKGQAEPEESDPTRVLTGEPLSDEEIERLLNRLPELFVDPQDSVDFRLPPQSLPPPRTGETIDEPFPPDASAITPPAVDSGPLEVLRFAPEGEIPLAPFVNVTFNQPMVPLTTLAELTKEDVPVNLEPDLPGTWTWVGTKTLNFVFDSDAIDRLPMATEYRATIPAGITSASGAELDQSVSWTFSTPPPTMINYFPSHSPQPLEPIFFIQFDQRINPSSVLETIQVSADGQPVQVVLASESDIEDDETVSRLVENAGEARWLAFKVTSPLPTEASISVVIGPGTPSAEGPLVTQAAESFSFQTYAPLRIEDHGCSWWGDGCPPLTGFYIDFNNPLDFDVYEESMLEIEPSLPGATVNIYGDRINIQGATEGRTTYKITVDADIQDIFGQTLGKDTTLSFKVGSAEPVLVGPEEHLVTLDPALEQPNISVYTINHNRLSLKAYAVEPADWPEFKLYLQDYYRRESRRDPPGREVIDETIPIESPADALTETVIDLSEGLEGDNGHLVVVIEPRRGLSLGDDEYHDIIQTWIQVTDIGLDALVDNDEMILWATGLDDGAPLSDISIVTYPGGQQAQTGADGVASFPIPSPGVDFLLARDGDDVVFLPRSNFVWGDDRWLPHPTRDLLRWYVFDDRQMYRPGEEVHLKGWLRHVGGGPNGDIGPVGDRVSSVHYSVMGPQGNDLLSGTSDVNALGGFDFAFTLPDNANLGYAQITMNASGSLGGLDGDRYHHSFQIQEFRRPEFEVTARNETTGPYYVGDHAIAAVSANYFAGGPLPNAEVTWQVSSSPSNYSPPNWPDFTFGKWVPWWFFYEAAYYEAEYFGPYSPDFDETTFETFTGVTDSSGNHYLRLDFDEADELRPFSVIAEASVMDVNRQSWAAATSMLVHPAEQYVGLRSDTAFVERGTPLEIEIIVTDLDGNPVSGRPIEVQAGRLEWKYSQGAWREEEQDIQTCNLESAQEPATCTFETPVGGEYQITAVVTDEIGRKNLSQFSRWVSGGQRPPEREVSREEVLLIPDKETYEPGDVAHILVQAPFSPAEGLLTVARDGFLYTERFKMSDETITLQVPIEDKHIPNLNIQVDVVGAAPRLDDQGEVLDEDLTRPAFASGQMNLSIPPVRRTLSLEIEPDEVELEPGGETTVHVRLTDASGEPVAGAELAAVVVDEAVLALSNYQLADPVAVFYLPRSSGVHSTYGRASIVLANPENLAEELAGRTQEVLATRTMEVAEGDMVFEAEPAMAAAPAEEGLGFNDAADSSANQPIRVRSDFNPLATFAPEVRTNRRGQAQIEVQLPDNLTRYRIMVVAVDDNNHFGSAEANLVARLPLMVRPSAPRFLNFGDQFELPVVLQNQTDEPMLVDVVVETGNLLMTDNPGRRVEVPARDRIEVRFPAMTDTPGTARMQIAVASNEYADAATVELPVYTPATTEAFATYGVVDEGAIMQPVAAPGDIFSQFGGLEINTSSTALQALTDAVLYLTSYPFESSTQLASRILAVAALRDVLTAFSADGLPSPEEMESAVQRDIEELQGLQNYDGGFPYWAKGKDSIPFNTIHVAHALQMAEQKGYQVPEDMQYQVLEYLRFIEDHYPSWYNKRIRQTLSAYALYVRHIMGDSDPQKARQLYDEAGVEELSLDAVAWIWLVLNDDSGSAAQLDEIRRHINNRAVETPSAANFTVDYGDQAYLLLHSDRRTDAIILDALMADDPDNDLIPKVVNGLLAHRTRGRWGNTQENVFVLLALDRYFRTFEGQTPDFVASIWLGDNYAGSHEFVGRTTERHETNIPMSFLVDELAGDDETQDLVLSKDGPGRLYYRLGLSYAPRDLELDPLDMGFVVQRSYEAVDDPDDVYRDEDGIWHIKAGARVRVRLTMVAENRRYHVALADPLPAGLEIVNPSLAVSGSIPQDPTSPDYGYGWWWWWPWYEHQNMRDQRAEAFASLLWEGVYDYNYIARATTPGTFIVPPAKAEEMYSPEVFGRSASDIVVVSD